MIRIFGTTLAALLGLAFGSFLNVCLSRLPARESIITPRSHCRSCGRTLSWWENIPLLSWLALRGRCRTCNASISWRYPLVELAISILWAITAYRSISAIESVPIPAHMMWEEISFTVSMMLFDWILVALALLDAEHLWLPDWITLPALALGIVCRSAVAAIGFYLPSCSNCDFTPLACWDCVSPFRAAVTSLLSAAFAAGIILLIRWTYWLIRRREGIGLGDAKLMAMLGAWLGLSGALLSFAVGVMLGAAFALVVLAIPAARRESDTWLLSKMPFGTFICIGGIISALWGAPLIATYMRLVGL